MLSDKIKSVEATLDRIRGLLPYDTAKALQAALSAARDDALVLESQVVSPDARADQYPDNVINIAAILHRHGVRAGVSTTSNDEGGAA